MNPAPRTAARTRAPGAVPHVAAARAAWRWGLLLVLAACGEGPRPPEPGRAPARYAPDGRPVDPAVVAGHRRNVLLICLDTVRADAFAPWSKEPRLPETSAWFARHGVAFTQASTAAPWTGPAVASLLTGLLPSKHGARDLATDFTLVPGVVTVAEILAAQGWRRAAFAGGGWVSSLTGMLQGFEHMQEPFSFQAQAQPLLESFSRVGRESWFVFAHTFEAHDPYLAPPARPGRTDPFPPELDGAAIDREAEQDGGRSLTRRFLLDWRSRRPIFENAHGARRMQVVTRYLDRGFREDPQGPALAAEARAAYDEGLRRLDRAVAGFLRDAQSAGLLEGAVVVLASDHGEAFGEHGMLHHGRMLHDVLVHVPLLVAAPGFPAGAVVEESCSLLDVLPTICELVGLPPPEGIDGRSLVPLVNGGAGRPVAAEELRSPLATGFPVDEALQAVRDARWTWIRTTDRTTRVASEALYDRRADPGEATPVDASKADLSDAFRAAQRAAREGR